MGLFKREKHSKAYLKQMREAKSRQKAEEKERKRKAQLAKIKRQTEYNIAKAEKAESDARRRKALAAARKAHPLNLIGRKKSGARRRGKRTGSLTDFI